MSGRPIVRCQTKGCGRFLHEDCIARKFKRKTLGLDDETTPPDDSEDSQDDDEGEPRETNETDASSKPKGSQVPDAKKVSVYIVHKKEEANAGKVSWKLVIEDTRSGMMVKSEKRLTCSKCHDQLSQ